MKAVVIGIANEVSMEQIMAVFPRHEAVVDQFIARGDVIGIGPFSDRRGSLSIFRSREAAQAFVEQDPFVSEGIIKSYEIREWADEMLA
ncbi:MAG TPA: YciI family protein [Polyangiaceae bacterium]|nr:YciI family protein [Polyangiaceae bacterium]